MTLGVLLLAGLAGTLDVADRTEFRLRSPGSVVGAGSLDVETDPDARLTLSSKTLSLFAEYWPQLTVWDFNLPGVDPVLLNRATLRGDFRTRRFRLMVSETASYGTLGFASLALQPGPGGAPAQVTPTPAPITLAYEASVSSVEGRWDFRRFLVTATAGYQLSGGATADAQQLLPLQSGPLGTVSGDYALTRRDGLVTTANASEAAFTTGLSSVIVGMDEAWRHAWTHTTTTLLRAGFAEAAMRGVTEDDTLETTPGPYRWELDPVAEARFQQALLQRGDTGDLTLDARLGPTVNPLIGVVDERVEGTVGGHYFHGAVALRGQVTWSESIPTSRVTGVALLYGELAVSYRLSRSMALELGTRSLWQDPTASRQALAAEPYNALFRPVAVRQEVGFVAFIIHADPLHF